MTESVLGGMSESFSQPGQISAVAIVVNWNSGEMLARCINSMRCQRTSFRQIVVVDNCSSDDSVDSIDTVGSNVKVVRSLSNLGFAAGCNLGVREAQESDWLAFINADAQLQEDWLEQMAQAINRRQDFQFFASRQLMAENPDRLDGAGDAYHVSGLHWRRGYRDPSNSIMSQIEVFGACGAAALYRSDLFRKLGGFDESFFCYAEDVDLAFRLRLSGNRCMYVPHAVVHHVGSAVTGKHSDFTVYHGHRNLEWAFFKNMPTLLIWLYLPQHLILNFISIVWFTLRGQGKVIVRAKWDALKGLPWLLRQRREIQRTRTVSAWELRRVMAKGWLAPYIRKLR